VFDLRLNSHSRLNLIQALIQAIHAGADEALMLDPRGFVASCNSTNFFIVRGDELWTSTGAYSFKGITQASVVAPGAPPAAWCANATSRWPRCIRPTRPSCTGTLGGVTPVVAKANLTTDELLRASRGPCSMALAALCGLSLLHACWHRREDLGRPAPGCDCGAPLRGVPCGARHPRARE
jgi:branched-subunit amino acid aminotransferase/4-amino-4-deoxychorismate lyase